MRFSSVKDSPSEDGFDAEVPDGELVVAEPVVRQSRRARRKQRGLDGAVLADSEATDSEAPDLEAPDSRESDPDASALALGDVETEEVPVKARAARRRDAKEHRAARHVATERVAKVHSGKTRGWIRHHRRVTLLAAVAVVVAGAAVVTVAIVGGDGGGKTATTQPRSQNPVVASYQDQLPALAQAVRQKPDDASTLRDYGVALYATGDVNGAKAQYEAELKVNPSDSVLLNNLGNVYRDLGTYDKAAEFYQKSIAIDPKTATSYMNLANLYQYTLSDRDKAIQTLKDAIASLPDNADVSVLLGMAYEQSGDKDNARTTFNAVLKLDPSNAAALAGIKRLDDAG